MGTGFFRIYYAEDADDEAVEELRSQIRLALGDPNYTVITNFSVGVVDVPGGAVATVEDGREEHLARFREELEKKIEDPDHVIVLPFCVQVGPFIVKED